MIETNIKNLLIELEKGNCFGERVALVAATKTRSKEEVRRAISAGICHVGENRVQEYVDKYDAFEGATRHFIGHLQTNKVKYLVGRCDLIHSVDRDELAKAIAQRAVKLGVTQNVLVQINIGSEQSKGGYSYEEGLTVLERLTKTDGIRVRGLMAMLPMTCDEAFLSRLATQMRALYDEAKMRHGVEILSMGMSGDWRLCLDCGANMIRLGTAIFGEREYPAPLSF